MNKGKIIAVDLDGVIASHKKEGENYEDLLPMPGAVKALQKLNKEGWIVKIHTARGMLSRHGDVKLIEKEVLPIIEKWLDKWAIPYYSIEVGKIYADVYLDDKAVKFNNWSETLKQL